MKFKRKNLRGPCYKKSCFVDGIDIANLQCFTYEEMLKTENINHNSDIQFAMYSFLSSGVYVLENFIKEAKIEYRKNKKYHDSKIKDEFDKLYKEDCEIKFSSVKKNYIYNFARNLSKQKAGYWLEKSFLQNNPDAKIVYAFRELSKIKNDNSGDKNKVISLLEDSLESGLEKSAEILIPLYLTGKNGFGKNEKRANEIIKMFDTKDYNFHLANDNSYCSINKIDKVLENNNSLCNLMVELHDKMTLLKEQIDSYIKEGKSYYKGYKIIGEIGFYLEDSIKVEGNENYDGATCDWKIIFDEKSIPNKVNDLDFWKNHNKGDLDYVHRYICRATHDFIYPKNKKIDRNCNFIPFEIFKNANENNFYFTINLVITKYHLPEKQINKNPEEYLHYKNYYEGKNLRRKLFWFEKNKILKIARKMLDYEFEINSTGKKIKSELELFTKNNFSNSEDLYFDQKLNYKFSHPLGIITKKDAMFSKYVNDMMSIYSYTMGSSDSVKKEVYSDNWLEFFWDKPYCDYHLCYTNHSFWDHCNLGTKDILKMKLNRFSSQFEIEWTFSNEENEDNEEKGESEEIIDSLDKGMDPDELEKQLEEIMEKYDDFFRGLAKKCFKFKI